MPYQNTIVFWVSVITAFLLSMTGWWVMTRALWPRFAARAQTAWTHRPFAAFLIGAAAIVVVILIVRAIGGPGVLVVAAALGVALSGASGLAGVIGTGLASPNDSGREWFRTLKGGIALSLSTLVPLLGWFLVLPIMLAGGIGAAVFALMGSGAPATATADRHDEPGWEIAQPPVSTGHSAGVNG